MVDGGWEEARCYHFTTAWRLPLMHARHKDTKIPRSSAVRSRHHTRRGEGWRTRCVPLDFYWNSGVLSSILQTASLAGTTGCSTCTIL